MDITFRTLGPWGPGKGANLQPSEVDSNFWSIAQAILDLQENPSLPNGIASITVAGTQMTIYLNDGSVMGPFTLPVLVFRWRGEWEASTAYDVLDVFTVLNTGIFMVQVAHISDTFFDPSAPAYLQLFGSADASLSALPDVHLTNPLTGDALIYGSPAGWYNAALGSMAYQNAAGVMITGGRITGMQPPFDATEVATKGYVDALPAGMTSPSPTMMANISGIVGPATPQTLSDFLDYVLAFPARGALLYRSGTGWIALAPGSSGEFLKTLGAGADPMWAPAGSGVTSITAGTGIDTTPDNIVSTGTVALAPVADNTVLANISGTPAAPTPTTLTLFLDHVLGAARGAILTRAIGGWVALAPGTSGYYLKTLGAGADLIWDSPPGSGTVTSVASGTGLTGGPITGTGTLSLAAIADLSVLANTSGGSAVPVATTATLLLDRAFGTAQGSLLYRSASAWVALTPGASGQVLTTGGAAANPTWQNAPTTGGSVGNLLIISNITGTSAVPSANTLSNILDAIISSARGTLLYRTNSGWTGLPPGASGQVLETRGGAGDPTWASNGGALLAISSPAARDILVYNSSSAKFENARPKYEIGCYVPGTMVASQNLLYHRFSKAVTLPANLGGHLNHNTVAGGGVAATASTAIILAQALAATPTTFATVATITFAAGSVTGTLSTQAAISFAQGDVLRIRGPAPADATFADFHMSLVGFET